MADQPTCDASSPKLSQGRPVQVSSSRNLDPPEEALLDDGVGYLHLDVDVLEPSVGRANYLPVPGSLSVEQLSGAIAALRRQVPCAAPPSPRCSHAHGDLA